MSTLEKLKEKAKGLEAKDPKAAIEAWLEALKAQEEGDSNPDLGIYNRVGDLYIKIKDPGQAADYYERAVDRYAELGFHNNAIAMCNKVLRNAPTRHTTYLKLAKLYASKGFLAEAKQNFIEYAERMQKAGKIQQAFSALKEFTDLSPESEGLRAMLEEHLQMYGTPERRSSTSVPVPPPAAKPETKESLSKSRKTSSLVFLDLDEPAKAKRSSAARVTPVPARQAPPAPAPEPELEPEPEPDVEPALDVQEQTLLSQVTPELDTSLEIESTSLAGEEPAEAPQGTIEGLESRVEFSSTLDIAPSAPSLRSEVAADDVEPVEDLEPTIDSVEVEAIEVELEPLAEDELEIEEEPAPKAAPTPPPAPPKVTPVAPRRPGAPPAPAAPAAPQVKPVVPKRPAAAPPPPAPAPPKRKTVVEVPPLELEPDFETEATAEGHDLDEEPLTMEEARPTGTASLGFETIEDAPETATIEELEARVADAPDDPEAHRALGEALVEAGERERGIEELDHATAGLENTGDLEQAQGLVEEILRLDPNSVRHRQKQVEYAFKSGDKARLIDAYLELADTLLRGDLPDKARAVYQRVAEHDSKNERAKAALSMLAPAAPPVPAAAPRAKEGKVQPKDAKMKVRDEPTEAGDFIDLGALVMEDDTPARDTRMKVEDEEPTGDEEKDFHDMLARFKQGIEENIDEADFQSHYDLGVAFKEMGLLDEAIAEFQKALRQPDGKLRTSEALGTCFFEKGAYVVAESILRRGLELPASGDQERMGVLYWLGRTLEEQGKKVEARELYGRVFAVDIRFADVGERVRALAKAK